MEFSESDLSDLKVIDHKIVRLITGAQSKVNTKMLYLETGEITIPNVISVRRLMYFKLLLKRHDQEITKRVLISMTKTPKKDDWIHLIKSDLEEIDMYLDNSNIIQTLDKSKFKQIVKTQIRKYSLQELETTKEKDNCKITWYFE